jgi:hypothetical protein
VCAGHLSAAIEAENACKTCVLVPILSGQDCSDASVNAAIIRMNRFCVNENARDVCNGIKLPGGPFT